MPAYSFKEQFIELIKSGVKAQTIRGKRKHQAKKGDTLYLYYGMRTKWCTKIGEAVCRRADDITISERGSVFVNGEKLDANGTHSLAKNDGFEDFNEMYLFWVKNNSLPFHGDIIYWENFKQS